MLKSGFFGFLRRLTTGADSDAPTQKASAGSRKNDGADFGGSRRGQSEDRSEISIDPEVSAFCVETMSRILALQGFEGVVSMGSSTAQRMIVDIEATEDLGRIIGRDGGHLEALQTLLRAIVHRRFSDLPKIVLDAGNYRRRRRGSVKTRAQEVASKVLDTGRPISLEPMSSGERRMVHMMFENHDTLQTLSKGDGDRRCVIIAPRGRD